jgi:hypothetical protein
MATDKDRLKRIFALCEEELTKCPFKLSEISIEDNSDCPSIMVHDVIALGSYAPIVGLILSSTYDGNLFTLKGPAVPTYAMSFFSYKIEPFREFCYPIHNLVTFEITFENDDIQMAHDDLRILIDYMLALSYMPEKETSWITWIQAQKEAFQKDLYAPHSERMRIVAESFFDNVVDINEYLLNQEILYKEFLERDYPFYPYYDGSICPCKVCGKDSVCAQMSITDMKYDMPICIQCYPETYTSYRNKVLYWINEQTTQHPLQ